MAEYSTKKALIDIGFVDGYFHSRPSNIENDGWYEVLILAFERIEGIAIKGSMLDASPSEADYRQFLCDLGFIRGWAWQKAVPDAVSCALDRLIDFFSESLHVTEIIFAAPAPIEPFEKMVSDEIRHEIREGYRAYAEVSSIVDLHGIPTDIVERVLEPIRDLDAEAAEEAAMAAEDEKAVAEAVSSTPRPTEGVDGDDAPGRSHNSIPDDQADAVREMSETMTDDEIGDQLGVSRDTVLRFREKHGIKKKRGPRQGLASNQWEPWQKAKLVEMKLAGTYSWSQIGEAVGKTANQCSGMWHWEKKKSEAEPDRQGGDEAVVDEAALKAEESEADLSEDEESEEVDQAEAVPVSTPEPSPPHRLTVAHPGYAGKREDGQLNDEDWPDIRGRLARGDTRRAIASDYDAQVDDLDFFIASNQRREAKQPPGESRAPL